jgi:hypothetical protein
MPTSPDECVQALREAAEQLGESPTRAQYDDLGLTPASGTIMQHMGGWNEAKRTAGLETFDQGATSGTEVQPKPEWVEIPDDVEWEELTGQQRWYYKNRGDRIERKERRRQELRRWLDNLKREELACVRCGEGRAPCLDFHHPDEKELGIAEMVGYGYSKESIAAEIEECVVLCANCHRVEHYSPPTEPD